MSRAKEWWVWVDDHPALGVYDHQIIAEVNPKKLDAMMIAERVIAEANADKRKPKPDREFPAMSKSGYVFYKEGF